MKKVAEQSALLLLSGWTVFWKCFSKRAFWQPSGREKDRIGSKSCKEFRRVYLIAPSGAAASLAQRIESLRVIAYEDLGTEAIFEIDVRDFPLIVATDVNGSDFFTLNRR